MDNLPQRAWRFIQSRDLLRAGERVVLGLSGGPDSVALALVLLALRDDGTLPLDIRLAHLNHCLRGAESDADERFCRAFAEAHGLPLAVERAEVRREARSRRLSLEAAARDVRYGFLARVALAARASAVATGHHADDVAETVLLRIVRGAALAGLGAVAPSRPLAPEAPGVRLVRPLLPAARADVLAYLRERGQAFRRDSSNLDTRHARNRVRHVLIPALAREFPTFSARSLCTLNDSALEAAALIDATLEELWPRLCRPAEAGAVVLDAAVLREALPAVRKAAAVRACASLSRPGAPSALTAGHLDDFARLPGRPVGAAISLPDGVIARREHGIVRLSRSTGPEGLPVRRLCVPGAVSVPEAALAIEARALPPGALDAREAARRATGVEVYLDLDAAGSALEVRSRRPGDRFHPLGAPGERRLKEFLIDRKVPRSARGRLPLVTGRDGRIVWVVGQQIGHAFRLTGGPSPVLQLRAVPAGAPDGRNGPGGAACFPGKA